MSFSDWMSLAAIAIALGSLVVSVRKSWFDRPRLKVSSEFIPPHEDGDAAISVKAVNAGRRPIILRLLGGDFSDGSSWGGFLGEKDLGLRLGENEFFERTLYWADFVVGPNGEELDRLWFEDSVGRRYPLPESHSQIGALFGLPSGNEGTSAGGDRRG